MRSFLPVVFAVSVAGTQTIPELAAATPDLSTLVAALDAAELTTTLAGNGGGGGFTVFAPTNAAFDTTLPKGLKDSLLQPENKAGLQRVLLYHVTDGKAMSTDLTDGSELDTKDFSLKTGGYNKLTVDKTNGVKINNVTVSAPDNDASNGVVHIIDGVLIPSDYAGTIVSLASATPTLSTLVAAVTDADLVTTLSGPGPFTVFAPLDSAFAALPKGLLTGLRQQENIELLKQLLTYHVASGATLSSELTNNMIIPTVEGNNLTVTLPPAKINDAAVTKADVVASNTTAATNGIVHLIDAVLTPPGFQKTVVDLAIATPTLSTLVAAVTAADLVTTLSGPGPFTVFAPTDAAFDALPKGLKDGLLQDANKALLARLLKYHVVSGATLSSELTNNMIIPTVEGSNLTVTLPPAKINDAAVTKADVVVSNNTAAFNGIVHVIDKVVMYPDFAKTIVDLASATPDLSTLVQALGAADLVTTLQSPGPFTVFAPADSAFSALPKGLLAGLLLPANQELLKKLLQYHVVQGATLSSELTNGMSITTVEGNSVTAMVTPSSVMINAATVTAPDLVVADPIAVTNGVTHKIDSVIYPPGFNKTVVDLAIATENLTTLVTAVQAGELVDTLTGPGPFTVFAPTNAAFNALPAGMLANLLLPANKDDLVKILTYHVVSGATLSTEITNGMAIPTVQGTNLVAKLMGGAVMINDATVTMADVVVSNNTAAFNGIVHIIDTVLNPDSAPPPPVTASPSMASSDDASLSGGGIAGLIIGLLVLFALMAFVGFKVMNKRQAARMGEQNDPKYNQVLSAQ